MKILIINGPNINLLGTREPEIYGSENYDALEKICRETCAAEGITCEIFQSNHEGAIVDSIQNARGNADAIIINPAAYTHTSIAILDALKAVALPAVEVHISDPLTREPFRHTSYAGQACKKTIAGQGLDGYRQAILFLCRNKLSAYLDKYEKSRKEKEPLPPRRGS